MIQQFSISIEYANDNNGHWVRYDDHLAEVEVLDDRIAELEAVFNERCAAFDAEAARLEAELAATKEAYGQTSVLRARILEQDARIKELETELEEAIANFADPKDKRRIAELEAALRGIAMYGDPDIPYGDTWQRYFEQVRDTARKAVGFSAESKC